MTSTPTGHLDHRHRDPRASALRLMACFCLLVLATACSRESTTAPEPWESCEQEAQVDASLETDAERARGFDDCMTGKGWTCGVAAGDQTTCEKRVVDGGDDREKDAFDSVANPFTS